MFTEATRAFSIQRPGLGHDESRLPQGIHERGPAVGGLVGIHNHHRAAGLEDAVRLGEGLGHHLLVGGPGLLLAAAMPDGIEVFKVAEPVKKLSACAWARYRITLTTRKSAAEIQNALSGSITVLKKTKTKELYCDIAAQIKELSVYEQDGKVVVETVLPAAGNNYLNPNYIAAFLADKIDGFFVRRIFLYDSDGKPLE